MQILPRAISEWESLGWLLLEDWEQGMAAEAVGTNLCVRPVMPGNGRLFFQLIFEQLHLLANRILLGNITINDFDRIKYCGVIPIIKAADMG